MHHAEITPFIGPNGLKYLNVTAHPLNLFDLDCGEFVVPPSGWVVNVEIEVLASRRVGEIQVDYTRPLKDAETEILLRQWKARDVIIIGSSTAAIAYPDLVYAPVMVMKNQRLTKVAHARRFSVPVLGDEATTTIMAVGLTAQDLQPNLKELEAGLKGD
ncbi:MAG: hypothetical protein N3A60_05555 [Thermanaerothrix sp.]|nr:hypothetical protein [Thermanaerothrix sp.]